MRQPAPPSPGREPTPEQRTIERYLLLAERRGRLVVGRVHHRPYPLRCATVRDLRDELIAADGLPEPPGPPPIVHFSPGVDGEVFAPRPVRRPGSCWLGGVRHRPRGGTLDRESVARVH